MVTRGNFNGKIVALCFVVNFVANHVINIVDWVARTKTVAISMDQVLNIGNIPGSEVSKGTIDHTVLDVGINTVDCFNVCNLNVNILFESL